MELQGIVFIQIQGIDTVVDFQGNTFIQTTYIYSQKINSRKLYLFKELYSSQGNYINSRKLYSFKEIIFIQVSKKQYYNEYFHENRSNPKKIWTGIKRIIALRPKCNHAPKK